MTTEELLNRWLASLLLDEQRDTYHALTKEQKMLVLHALKYPYPVQGSEKLFNDLAQDNKTINHLRSALECCKTTFEEYVTIHKDKLTHTTTPNDEISRKIARNQELADMCRDVLAMQERQK